MAAVSTRERIMDVAVRLFAARGVAATPVTAIEEAAGLSPGSGSFYRHFRDRAELLDAVVRRELAHAAKPEPAPGSPDDSPADLTARMLRRDLEFLRSLRPLIAILMWESGRAPEIAEHLRVTMLDRGIELSLQDLPDAAAVPAVREDPEAAAAVMTSAVVGYFLAAQYFGAPAAGVDEERFTRMLARLLTVDSDPPSA